VSKLATNVSRLGARLLVQFTYLSVNTQMAPSIAVSGSWSNCLRRR